MLSEELAYEDMPGAIMKVLMRLQKPIGFEDLKKAVEKHSGLKVEKDPLLEQTLLDMKKRRTILLANNMELIILDRR